MSVTEVFQRLGAPLRNQRRSWGAVRAEDGTVFLRVWQDEGRIAAGKYLTQIGYSGIDAGITGFDERMRHIELIRAGAPCYLVMCEAKDVDETPRDIKATNDREVFKGGPLLEVDGEIWIERVQRVPIKEAQLRK